MIPEKKEYYSLVDGVKDCYWRCDAGAGRDCVVVLHGHGGHGDQLFSSPKAEGMKRALAERSLCVLSPELRGNAWMSPAAAADLVQILSAEKKAMGFRRCFLICASMGGTGALIFAMLHPEWVDAVAVLGGATDLRRYRDWCRAGDLPIHQEIAAAIDGNYAGDDFVNHSVCEHWERLSMPLRFYHSEADRVIPVSEMRALQKKMKNCSNAVFAEVPALETAPNWWDDHDAPIAYFATVLDEFCRLELS